MPRPSKYSPELRDRATRMAIDARKDPETAPGALARIAKQLDINPETLRNWVRRVEAGQADAPGIETVSDIERIRRLEKENAELRRANEILKTASGFLRGRARPATPLIVAFIDQHRHRWPVEAICTALTEAGCAIAPSTYYAARTRPPSTRSVRDEYLTTQIMRVYEASGGIYGRRKIRAALHHEGITVAKCTIERLCAELGIRGVVRGKFPRTTRPAPETERPADLVDRQFRAEAPNQLWVADITYVRTEVGWVYVAFVLDVFSRMIVGWQTSTRMFADLAIDALAMGLWQRRRAGHDLTALIHHSDRGVHYRAIRYTQALDEAGAIASVGSRGDSYDNAMAEALNSLYKHELIYKNGPWTSTNAVEIATAEWVHWYNTTRLHSALDYQPPAAIEADYWTQNRVLELTSQNN
ncbi:IS3 family transposase [Gordonia malaquae]